MNSWKARSGWMGLGMLGLGLVLVAGGCHEHSSVVEVGSHLTGGNASLRKTNLAYVVTRPDRSMFKAAFLRFNNTTSHASVHFSDPESEGEDGVMVVSGVRPVTRSTRIVAAAKSTMFLQASSGTTDVIVALEAAKPGHAVDVFSRGANGERGALLTTLAVGEFVRVENGVAGPKQALSTDATLAETVGVWARSANRLWGLNPAPAPPAGVPGGAKDPDPDDPAPPIPPKPPSKPAQSR